MCNTDPAPDWTAADAGEEDARMHWIKVILPLSVVACLSVSGAFAWQAEETRVSFEDVPAGRLPTGWRAEATHPYGRSANWYVREDATSPSPNRVLALTIHDDVDGVFNLCWTDRIQFKDGTLEVKVKARQGSTDQGGGAIWRARDRDNYYIARWNPLENNFRLYYVKAGRRRQLESAVVRLPIDRWHTITIHQHPSRITAFLDGKKMLQANDQTFPQPGGIGVWTKSDAASWFDDLVIRQP